MNKSLIPRNEVMFFFGGDFEPELPSNESSYNETEATEQIPEQTIEDKPIPSDKYNLIYIVFYLLGISILLPWYFFITCNNYWLYRFREIPNETKFFIFLNDNDNPSNRTTLQAEFTSYISIASTVPSTIFLFLNLYYFRRFSIHWRIVISSVALFLLFIETTILVHINTDEWQKWFFVVTLTTIVFLNISTGLLQAALCGILMKFPLSYISAFSSGQSLAGIFAAIAMILTSFEDTSLITSTFFYFIFADALILISFIGYLAIRRTEYFNYYAFEAKNDYTGSVEYERLDSESRTVTPPIRYQTVQKKIWIPCIGLFFCYMITTCVYPAVAVLVCLVNVGVLPQWFEKRFAPFVTYLLYCTCEYLGRIIAGCIQKPKNISFIYLSILRIVFIPLLMFCNAEPRHHLPVLIRSDLLYILIIIGLAVSNGYLTNLTFVITPKFVDIHEQETASTMLIIWLSIALSFGSLLSLPLVNLL